jgi:hypothetical protein
MALCYGVKIRPSKENGRKLRRAILEMSSVAAIIGLVRNNDNGTSVYDVNVGAYGRSAS